MKKFLLLTFVASLFAVGSAFAHCGACGASGESHDHAAAAEKACCGSEAGKCCSDKAAKSDCAKACCSDKKAKSGSDCAKACCAKDKAKDETAVAAPPACCPAGKSGKPA